MDLKDFPKIKDAKNKVRKTFLISEDHAHVYVMAREKLNIDTPKICNDAISNALESVKLMLEKTNKGT
jgi:hypothetical protein